MTPNLFEASNNAQGSALQAVRARRSFSKVTDDAPSHEELATLVSAMVSIADHSSLRPWRLIELRGDRRQIIGKALADAEIAAGKGGKHSRDELVQKFTKKAMRAPLVIAVIARTEAHKKVPVWEQEAVASGVAHTLGLLLHEAGWATIWRSGPLTRSEAVHKAHGLADGEIHMGWIYVGGIPERDRTAKPRKPLNLAAHLSTL